MEEMAGSLGGGRMRVDIVQDCNACRGYTHTRGDRK